MDVGLETSASSIFASNWISDAKSHFLNEICETLSDWPSVSASNLGLLATAGVKTLLDRFSHLEINELMFL